MKKIKLIEAVILFNLLSRMNLREVKSVRDRLAIVHLVMDLKKHAIVWQEVLQMTKDLEEEDLQKTLAAEQDRIVEVECQSITPELVEQLIASNPEARAGELVAIAEIFEK